MQTSLDLITIGESLIELSTDMRLSEADYLAKYYGGDTLATAVAARRMGSSVGYVSKVGNDYFKEYLLDSWQNEGLDISNIRFSQGTNGVYFVARPQNDLKEFSYYRRKSAASMLNINDIDMDYILRSKAVYSTGVTQSLSINTKEVVREVFKFANANNIIVAYDPNFSEELWSVEEAREALYEVIDYLDIIFINTTKFGKELISIESINSVINYFWDKGVKTIVIKSTKDKGYYIGHGGEIVFIDFYVKEDTKDTTCAGDVFNGAFLHEVLHMSNYIESAKIAAIVAGLQSQGFGAIKSIPYKETVYKCFKELYD